MKKIISIILIVMFLSLLCCNTANEVRGDVTADGEVSESDLYLVQQHILGTVKLTKTEQGRADTNKDGVINIVDLANIQKIILGVD